MNLFSYWASSNQGERHYALLNCMRTSDFRAESNLKLKGYLFVIVFKEWNDMFHCSLYHTMENTQANTINATYM